MFTPDTPGMRPRRIIGVIVEESQVNGWQADPLSIIADSAEFLVLNHTKASSRPQALKHALYYALKLISLKSRFTRLVPLPEIAIREREGISKRNETGAGGLPSGVGRTDPCTAIGLHCEMGLLRIPSSLPPIISYHHRDPRPFRSSRAPFKTPCATRIAIER